MRKAFTLIELMVALGIMALILSFAGVIFRVCIDSHRMALANAEIMQKFRAITEQLETDLRGLRKDGEILLFWRAARKDPTSPSNAPAAFERFDRIMFFATGDFQTYGTYRLGSANPKVLRGNLARICYGLANGPSVVPADPNRPQMQKPTRRRLARTQHLLIPPAATVDANDPLGTGAFTDSQWREWTSQKEYDGISLRGWTLIPLARKADIISVVGDVSIASNSLNSVKNETAGGITVDTARPEMLHSLLCEGVGQFEIQGWSDARQRWIPEVNPDGDADLTDDTDFVLDGADIHPTNIPGLWYPRGPVILGKDAQEAYTGQMDEEHFNVIPGLGRALKFTFTLYDSRGLIKNGRTFTHIVYLDN